MYLIGSDWVEGRALAPEENPDQEQRTAMLLASGAPDEVLLSEVNNLSTVMRLIVAG